MHFKNLFLDNNILKAVEKCGYTEPTPIQEKTIPKVLENLDICASSHTGSGKTAAFVLPALQKLLTPSHVKGRGPRVLVLVPTRELAMQVATEATKYSLFMHKTKVVCVYGGVPYQRQMRDLAGPYEILVATPGRLMDFVRQKKISFHQVEIFVLDEADHMLDLGFIEDVKYIAELLPKKRQTLLFSATFKPALTKLCQNLLNDPIHIKVDETYEKHKNISQLVHAVDNVNHKLQILDHLLNDDAFKKVLIFTATKMYASQLTTKLTKDGHYVGALHGDMNQRKRTMTINQFRSGNTRILVATDVASRGIDVPNITHIINFDLPRCIDDYVHRIGRTGRAGATGFAISFISGKERSLLRQIELTMKQKISTLIIPGLEAKGGGDDFSERSGRGRRGRSGRGGRSGGSSRSRGFGEKSGRFVRSPRTSGFERSEKNERHSRSNDSGRSERSAEFGNSKRFNRDEGHNRATKGPGDYERHMDERANSSSLESHEGFGERDLLTRDYQGRGLQGPRDQRGRGLQGRGLQGRGVQARGVQARGGRRFGSDKWSGAEDSRGSGEYSGRDFHKKSKFIPFFKRKKEGFSKKSSKSLNKPTFY